MHKLLILLFSITFQSLLAQHPFYYKVDDEDGLPSNEVYQVLQDDFGFIWIGSDAGIFRYDGFNFTPYTSYYQNSRSMSHLKLDCYGNVWCQNFTGQLFRTSGDSLLMIADLSKWCRQFPQYTIDGKGNMWATTDSVLFNYSNNGKLIKKINSSFFRKSDPIILSEIEYDKHKNLIYIISLNRLAFSFKPKKINQFKTILLDNYTGQRSSILPLEGRMIILTEFNPQRKYVVTELNENSAVKLSESIPEKSNEVRYIINQTAKNEYWMASSNGAVLYNSELKKVNDFPVLFENRKISSVYRDSENNYWFTSLQDGIYIIPSIHLRNYNSNQSVIKDANISALTRVNDSLLYFGDYSGNLYSVNAISNQIQILPDQLTLTLRPVRKIVNYKEKLYSSRGPFFVRDKNRELSFPNINTIRDFVISNDTVYFASSDRCGFLSINSNNKANIRLFKGGKCVAYDPANKTAYYGTTEGLIASNKTGNKAVLFNASAIFATRLYYKNGELWIASLNHGLLILKDGKLSRFTHSKKIIGNTIRCFRLYNDEIFVSTEKGLNCLSLKIGSNRFYDAFDGLFCTEINDIEVANNKIYLATIKGLIVFPLKLNHLNHKAPGIKITSVKLNNKKLKFREEISLTYKHQNIEINFIGTGFRSRGKFTYAYQLKGLEDIVHTVKSESPKVIFSFLPPGKYEFVVQAINEDGLVSVHPSSLFITVDEPFWQKWWFYLSIAIATAILVALVFQFRIRYVKRQAMIKNKIILSQLTAIKAQMNPHFMFNTLNSIQDLILKSDIKNTNYYLSKFSNLMRKVLEASGHNEISVAEEIEILNNYLELEKLRFGDDFQFEISCTLKTDAIKLFIPSMIIQPFVENAMKHGLLHKKGIKQIDIKFEETDQILTCEVIDNGIGIVKAMEINQRRQLQHKSFATKATGKRIELINSSRSNPIRLLVSEALPGNEYPGTKIRLIIPLR